MPNVGPIELALVLVVALILLGPRRLPALGRSVGTGLREFKAAVTIGGDERTGESRKTDSAP